MNLLKMLFDKKKMNLSDCEVLRMEEDKADLLLGGFKEYQPIIYELSDSSRGNTPVNNLLVDESIDHKYNKHEK